jgi:large repetitive protein
LAHFEVVRCPSKPYSFTINVAPSIAGPNSLPDWTVGQPYPVQTIVPQGGTPGYSNFTIVGGSLPAGMTLDAVTGVISGTPTVAGPVNIQVQVQDSTGAKTTTPYSFVVNARPEIIQPDSLQNWTVGQQYPNTSVILANPNYASPITLNTSLAFRGSQNRVLAIPSTPAQISPYPKAAFSVSQ